METNSSFVKKINKIHIYKTLRCARTMDFVRFSVLCDKEIALIFYFDFQLLTLLIRVR